MAARVLIIEDHDDFRDIVRVHLEKQPFPLDIAEAVSGESGINKAMCQCPDIVLMDIRLPGINGIDAATRIKSFAPACSIIALTMFETDAFKKIFHSDDIAAYIGKSELYEKLVPTLKRFIEV